MTILAIQNWFLKKVLRLWLSIPLKLMIPVIIHIYKDILALYLVEEFFYAALDLKHLDWAQFFLKIVSKKFP